MSNFDSTKILGDLRVTGITKLYEVDEFTLNGQSVYVVSQTGNEITVYDANNFSIIKRITADTPSAVSNIGLRIEEPGL